MKITVREALIPVFGVFAFLFFLALVSYSPSDPGWTYIGDSVMPVQNAGGLIGSWFADVLFSLFGYMAYSLPIMMLVFAWNTYRNKRTDFFLLASGWFFVTLGGTTLCSLHFANSIPIPVSTGGLLGAVIAHGLLFVLSAEFISALATLGFATGLALIFSISWLGLCDFLGNAAWTAIEKCIPSGQLADADKKPLEPNEIDNKGRTGFSNYLAFLGKNGISRIWHSRRSPRRTKTTRRIEPHIGEDMPFSEKLLTDNTKTFNKSAEDSKAFVQSFMVAQAYMDSFGELPEDTDSAIAAKLQQKPDEPDINHPDDETTHIPVTTEAHNLQPQPENLTTDVPHQEEQQSPEIPAPEVKIAQQTTELQEPEASDEPENSAQESTKLQPLTSDEHKTESSHQVDNKNTSTDDQKNPKMNYDELPEIQPQEHDISEEHFDSQVSHELSNEEMTYFSSLTNYQTRPLAKPTPHDATPVLETSKPRKHIDYIMPSTDLLKTADEHARTPVSHQELQEMGRLLEQRLNDYNVNAKVVAISPGPVITRFEVQPAAGVKVIRISNLAKDLARSLTVTSVRVVEVIPGKSTVGVEIPNKERQMVHLGDMINSSYYRAASDLSLALGADIEGKPTIVNLDKMPHLLVAGTTGSGKSVGVNSMLISILFKLDPTQVRMILVDPKMLELSVYNGIPHLLTPVITDMKDAANGLRWCVAEMERRYKLMSKLGVRNLEGYNNAVTQSPMGIADPLYTGDPEDAPKLKTLPFIIVVIDEFADMMMIVGKKVEELIARIAQKARAAGIHLILATQRPSVDVITGLIKANIPTRIAFQVSSKIDSRTILDQAGADQLLGHGDMLYLPPGTSVPHRVHGAFISDEEVHKVVEFWKNQDGPEYINEITRSEAEASENRQEQMDDSQDELYDSAVEFVIENQRVSISYVQRKLKIGYNRAARIIEAMEEQGIVSAMESNGRREILVAAPVD